MSIQALFLNRLAFVPLLLLNQFVVNQLPSRCSVVLLMQDCTQANIICLADSIALCEQNCMLFVSELALG